MVRDMRSGGAKGSALGRGHGTPCPYKGHPGMRLRHNGQILVGLLKKTKGAGW